MPRDEKLGLGAVTKLGILILFLLVTVSFPIAIVAIAEASEPALGKVPLHRRPDYVTGYHDGAKVIQKRYELRDQALGSSPSMICGYAKLVCKK